MFPMNDLARKWLMYLNQYMAVNIWRWLTIISKTQNKYKKNGIIQIIICPNISV